MRVSVHSVQRWVVTLLAASSLSIACEKSGESKPEKSEKSEKSATNKDDKAAPKAEPWSKKLTMDCPTHIKTAKIAMADIDGGYTVTVTSTDKGDVQRIVEYSAYMAGASKHAKDPEDALKRGGHTGNRNNNCPILLKDTVVTQVPVSGGATLTVKPKDAANLVGLRKKARQTLKVLLEYKAFLDEQLKNL